MARIDKYTKEEKANARIEKKRRKNAERRAAQAVSSSQAAPDGNKSEKAGGRSNKTAPKRGRRIRINKRKLILTGIAALAVLALMIRLVVLIGSSSGHHLSDEGLTHDERFANAVIVQGVDVSSYQGEINWKKVKSSEADFAFIRAGYRDSKTGELHDDARFEENMEAAEKAGVMKGAYFFSQAVDPEEAAEEAEYLLKLVEPYNVEMPLVIDFEIYEGGRLDQAIQLGNMAYASAYHDIVLAFCDKVEKAGYESCVYVNYSMLTNYMDQNIIGNEATIWTAQYDQSCSIEGNYMYWQCAEDAEISGINGPVDHDIWYIEPGKVYPTKAAGSKKQTSIGDCNVEFNKESYKLSNHRAEPKITVTTKTGKKLKNGKNYVLSYVMNTTEGTGYAVIRGTGKYKDWTAVPFTIE